jgi:predicted SAM-dependent methyltransferase
MDAQTLKNNLLRVLDEAIQVNKDQIAGPGAEDFPAYKYMLGIAHTLEDMKARVKDEHKNLYKQGTLFDDDK